MSPPHRRRLRRGAYLLPSLLTTGNIVLGFYALVSGIHGDFRQAALMLFLAAALDGVDGSIARLTGTESEFGREYDSLADLFSFGAVPAVLAYLWGLRELDRLGWLIAAFYLIAMATRLARFNVQVKAAVSPAFVGLPAPAAAGCVGAILFFAPDREWRTWAVAFLAAALILVGSLMVSTFRYWSFKGVDLRQRWSYRLLLVALAMLLVIAYDPPTFFLVVAVFYALSGPCSWLWGRAFRATSKTSSAELDDPS